MPSKATEYTFLPDINFAGDAKALSDLPRSLGGRTRRTYELLTGENPVAADEAAASPLNPDARLGHNHRGPPWGSAFRHPLAWITGKTANAGNLQQPANNVAAFLANASASSPSVVSIRDWVIWVPPFWRPTNGDMPPYGKLFLKLYGRVSAAVNTDFKVTASARELFGDPGTPTTQTMRLATTTEAPATVVTNEPFIITVPGYNMVNISLTNDTNRDVTITSIAICQVAKRKH